LWDFLAFHFDHAKSKIEQWAETSYLALVKLRLCLEGFENFENKACFSSSNGSLDHLVVFDKPHQGQK
jgi:hypothetical protein